MTDATQAVLKRITAARGHCAGLSKYSEGIERVCYREVAEMLCEVHAHVEEQLTGVEQLRSDLETARETNRRLNRRCQEQESQARRYERATNMLRDVGHVAQSHHQRITHWLDRLADHVREDERRGWRHKQIRDLAKQRNLLSNRLTKALSERAAYRRVAADLHIMFEASGPCPEDVEMDEALEHVDQLVADIDEVEG